MDEAEDSLLTENEGRTRKAHPRNCSKNRQIGESCDKQGKISFKNCLWTVLQVRQIKI